MAGFFYRVTGYYKVFRSFSFKNKILEVSKIFIFSLNSHFTRCFTVCRLSWFLDKNPAKRHPTQLNERSALPLTSKKVF